MTVVNVVVIVLQVNVTMVHAVVNVLQVNVPVVHAVVTVLQVNVALVHAVATVLQVNVAVDRGHSLGLTVRGGRDYGLGVYISGVDPYSVAENAGLKVSGLRVVCFVLCCFCSLLVAGLCVC